MNSASGESYANLLCIHINLHKQTRSVKWRVQMIPFAFLSSMVFYTEYTQSGNGRFSLRAFYHDGKISTGW
jgi:hypothetical protein